MAFNLEAFIWYLFLLDSIIANLIAVFGSKKWYKKQFGLASKYLPITKPWTVLYLLLVLWVGTALIRLGILPW